MRLATTRSMALLGLEGHLIDVEADLSDGLPRFALIGVPDTTLAESRDRVRSAILNSGEKWPDRRITVALSPAWLPKRGSSFDLAVAIALLAADGVLPEVDLSSSLFLGELALDGRVRGVRGVLPALVAAASHGLKRAVVPAANLKEARVVDGIEVIGVTDLRHLLHVLRDGADPVLFDDRDLDSAPSGAQDHGDLADVIGQPVARRALEIAATGRHHLLMIGSPGSGKTMLAERFATILPPLSLDESLAVSSIHSIAGTLSPDSPLLTSPPFVAPHHTASRTAIVGGGSAQPKPGAASLAHRGVLFIDEAPECAAGLLDSLRQPLETGSIQISRTGGSALYPAAFTLVLAANPCPCGRFSSTASPCSCTPANIRRYLGRLSGPLLDRIDLQIFIEPVSRVDLADAVPGERSEVVRSRVVAARDRLLHRWEDHGVGAHARIPSSILRREFPPDDQALRWLHARMERHQISARGFEKIIRLAWSICDLRAGDRPGVDDVAEAFALRSATSALNAA
jgi:magnesium chelatase family protein